MLILAFVWERNAQVLLWSFACACAHLGCLLTRNSGEVSEKIVYVEKSLWGGHETKEGGKEGGREEMGGVGRLCGLVVLARDQGSFTVHHGMAKDAFDSQRLAGSRWRERKRERDGCDACHDCCEVHE